MARSRPGPLAICLHGFPDSAHTWRHVVAQLAAAFFTSAQLRPSSYMFFFQHSLSEMIVAHDDWAFIRGLWNDWSPAFAADDDIANFVASVEPQGHLAGALR
jgi:hypothetical protein